MSLLMVLYATHSADTTKEFDVTDGWFFTRPTIDADTEDSDVTDGACALRDHHADTEEKFV